MKKHTHFKQGKSSAKYGTNALLALVPHTKTENKISPNSFKTKDKNQ